MLQSKVYSGRVSYAETECGGTLGERKKSGRGRKDWFEGKHGALISDALFEVCQQVRATLAKFRKTSGQRRTYVLHDRVYCADCVSNKSSGLVDDKYGKMRP